MKKPLTILLILTAIIFISGCMTSEKRINKFKRLHCKDSVSIQIKERIVTVPVQYTDSTLLEALLQCDSMGNVYYTSMELYHGKWSEIKSKLENNKLQVKTITKIKDSIRYIERDTNRYEQTIVEVPAKLTKWQEFWIKYGKWAFGISIILLVGIVAYIVWRIFRMKIKIDLTAP